MKYVELTEKEREITRHRVVEDTLKCVDDLLADFGLEVFIDKSHEAGILFYIANRVSES